jgi:diadenosine tetraphosphate (Ap4A) HIT family hydrolase
MSIMNNVSVAALNYSRETLLPHIPDLPDDYNLVLNHGALAGQSVKHLHLWVIPRFAGKPSSGKGFARLILEADSDQPREKE